MTIMKNLITNMMKLIISIKVIIAIGDSIMMIIILSKRKD